MQQKILQLNYLAGGLLLICGSCTSLAAVIDEMSESKPTPTGGAYGQTCPASGYGNYSSVLSSHCCRPGTPWQRGELDAASRSVCLAKLLSMFLSREGCASGDFKACIVDNVKQIELVLYHTAATREQYCDWSSLELRVRSIARHSLIRQAADNLLNDAVACVA